MIAFGATAAIATSIAQADIITYDIVWDDAFGGNASAVGSVTIDTVLASTLPGLSIEAFGTTFTDFSITITGTPSDDGTWTSAEGDFTGLLWDTQLGGFLDFHSELMSQGTLEQFNVIGGPGAPTAAPQGLPNLLIGSSGNSFFNLVSVTPVPAPGALALLGMGGIVAGRRRR